MTNNRRRGDSTLLVSFCNVRENKPSVAAIDLRREHPRLRWIEIKGGAHLRGARGLCFWNALICVGHQPGFKNPIPSGFVFLDPERGFKQVGEEALPSTPHSVCSRNGDLYFTMSQEDRIYKATPNGRSWEVSRYWTVPGSSGTEDQNHLNGIELVGGNLCISALGGGLESGFVYDIDRAEYMMRGIKLPHSLLEDSQAAWTCETRGSRLLSTDGDEYGFPGDHKWRVRGLAINDDYFYVGVSKNRIGSKSRGTLRGYEGVCRIYKLPRGSKEPELLIDLTDIRDEIYELMLV